MYDLFCRFCKNPSTSDFAVIHEIWPRFPTLNNKNFVSLSPPQPCILAGVDVQPRGVLKDLSDKSHLIWSDIGNIPLHNLINITKDSVTREFINYMRGEQTWIFLIF